MKYVAIKKIEINGRRFNCGDILPDMPAGMVESLVSQQAIEPCEKKPRAEKNDNRK